MGKATKTSFRGPYLSHKIQEEINSALPAVDSQATIQLSGTDIGITRRIGSLTLNSGEIKSFVHRIRKALVQYAARVLISYNYLSDLQIVEEISKLFDHKKTVKQFQTMCFRHLAK